MVPGWSHLPAILLGVSLARRCDALSAFCCALLTSFFPASDLNCTTAFDTSTSTKHIDRAVTKRKTHIEAHTHTHQWPASSISRRGSKRLRAAPQAKATSRRPRHRVHSHGWRNSAYVRRHRGGIERGVTIRRLDMLTITAGQSRSATWPPRTTPSPCCSGRCKHPM